MHMPAAKFIGPGNGEIGPGTRCRWGRSGQFAQRYRRSTGRREVFLVPAAKLCGARRTPPPDCKKLITVKCPGLDGLSPN